MYEQSIRIISTAYRIRLASQATINMRYSYLSTELFRADVTVYLTWGGGISADADGILRIHE